MRVGPAICAGSSVQSGDAILLLLLEKARSEVTAGVLTPSHFLGVKIDW